MSDELLGERIGEERAREAQPGEIGVRQELLAGRVDLLELRGHGREIHEPGTELRAGGLGVEVVGNGRHGTIMEIELAPRVTAGCKEQLGATEGRVTLRLVEVDAQPHDEAQGGQDLQLFRALERA